VLLEQRGRFASIARSGWEAFSFYDGSEERTRFLMEEGVSPFWTHPTLRLSFFRPVSALTHMLDYRVLRSAALSHVQSLIWYAAAAALAASLYRRILGARAPWVAGLAAVFFAFDHDHGMSVGWIAGRNALVTAVFGLAALHFQLNRGALGRALAPLSFALALGAGEAGAMALPYLFLAEAVLADDCWSKRAVRFAPHLVVLAAWAVLRAKLGFGAAYSGMYTEPSGQPLAFALRVLEELPVLSGAELGLPGVDAYGVFPRPVQLGMVAFGCLLWLAFAPLFGAVAKRDPAMRFFLWGGVLAVIPACATLPSTRALVLPSFGLLGALACGVEAVAGEPTVTGLARRIGRPLALAIGGAHVVLSPLVFQVVSSSMRSFELAARRFADTFPTDAEEARVVVITCPEPTIAGYALVLRDVYGPAGPKGVLTLASGLYASEVFRESERSLVVRQPSGFYHPGAMDTLVRDPAIPMRPGDRVVLSDVAVEILETTPGGIPTSIRVELPLPIERYRFVAWTARAFEPFVLPAVGEARRFEPRTMFEML